MTGSPCWKHDEAALLALVGANPPAGLWSAAKLLQHYHAPGANSARAGRSPMYMRVTRGRVDLARLDEVLALSQEVAAAVRRLPGYQSYVAGGDRASGRSFSVSTWDTEEHARWSPDVLGDILPRLQALGVQVDPPEFFEVTTT
jgi:hypothetical protein